MTAKEFLRGAREADRGIDEAMERLERMRAKLEAGRMSNLTGMPRGGALDWTETADMVIELEKRVNARIREMVRQKQAAMDAIRAVSDPRWAEVLELYYIDGYTWEKIAEIVCRDVRTVHRWHDVGLLMIKVPEAGGHDAGNISECH